MTVVLRQSPGTFSVQKSCDPDSYCARGGKGKEGGRTCKFCPPPDSYCRQGGFHDMIVNSACAFIPISDLSVTVKTWGTFPGTAVAVGDRTLKTGTVPGNRGHLVTLVYVP